MATEITIGFALDDLINLLNSTINGSDSERLDGWLVQPSSEITIEWDADQHQFVGRSSIPFGRNG